MVVWGGPNDTLAPPKTALGGGAAAMRPPPLATPLVVVFPVWLYRVRRNLCGELYETTTHNPSRPFFYIFFHRWSSYPNSFCHSVFNCIQVEYKKVGSVTFGRRRFGAADCAPPFGTWTFGRLDYRVPELGAGLLPGFF